MPSPASGSPGGKTGGGEIPPAGLTFMDHTHAIVRFAGDGVPVAVIARGLAVPSDHVVDILRTALHQGFIVHMPRYDWHPHERGRLGPLSGRTDEEIMFSCGRVFGVTPLQAALLSVLIRRNEVPKKMMRDILIRMAKEDRPDRDESKALKMVDVVMYHLRRKIAPFDLQIKTLWSSGYYMEPAARRRAQEMLTEGFHGEGGQKAAQGAVPDSGRDGHDGAPVGATRAN